MRLLLATSRRIDSLTKRIGKVVSWLILVAVIVSAGNATIRYTLDTSSNAWLELQWYLFAAVFLLCAGYTLLCDGHIRIDVIAGRFSRKTQTWIEIFGTIFFLLPMAVVILALSWPMFWNSYIINEQSMNAGGLVRWPAKLLVPVGFLLLVIQGFSELIKRVAFLRGHITDPTVVDHTLGASVDQVEAKARRS